MEDAELSPINSPRISELPAIPQLKSEFQVIAHDFAGIAKLVALRHDFAYGDQMFPRLHFGPTFLREVREAEIVKCVFRLIFCPVRLYSLRVDHEHSSRLEYANFAQQEVRPPIRLSCSPRETASVVKELSASSGHVIYLREVDIPVT